MPIVAVTGASGFLGEVLVRQLLTRHRVRVLLRQTVADRMAWQAMGCEVVTGDLDDDAAVERLVSGVDVVYHCAATLIKNDAAHSQRVNVVGTERVARASNRAGVRRFMYVSSTSVYGRTPRQDDTVTEALEPTNVEQLNNYSRTKYAGELVVRRLGREEGLEYTIVRPTNIYGLRSGPWFRQWERLLAKVPLAIGTVPIDLIYVNDVADGLMDAAGSTASADETFNLGHEMVPMRNLIQAVGEVTGRRARVLPGPVDRGLCIAIDRVFEMVTKTALSPSLVSPLHYPHAKAQARFGFAPRFPLAEGFADLQRQYRARAGAAVH